MRAAELLGLIILHRLSVDLFCYLYKVSSFPSVRVLTSFRFIHAFASRG